MKKTFTFLIILLFLAVGIKTMAQTAADYQFAGSTGTYTEITGSTTGITTGDEGLSSAINIGFTFTYCGIDYTQVLISTNVCVGLGTTLPTSNYSNALHSTTLRPLIAPLWDDNSSDNIQYLTDGTSPNRVFTVQWKNFKWKYSGTAGQNVQVKMYETSNKIEIIYGTIVSPKNPSASIGINDATGGSGHFLSVTPNATPSLSTVSSTTANNSIASNTGLFNGTLYTFTPPSGPLNPTTFTATTANSTEIDLSWAKNPANDNVMVAWNTSNTFGTPASGTSYSAGNTITGGGTVLYNGDQTTFNHTPVLSNTTYYYKAWSVDGTFAYSTGKIANATTPCGKNIIYPFTQNFEGSVPPTADCWSEVRTPSSSYGWGSSAGGYSGNCAAFETANNPSGNQSKLITPVLDLSGLSSACLKFYFRNSYGGDFSVLLSTDGGNTYPNILWSGLTGQSTWTEKLKDISAYTGAGYDNVRIAFQGTSNYNVDYIYLDNVVVEEIPVNAVFLMNPASKNFGEIVANSTSTPQIFTISNNGQTPLVINNGGITLTGTDAGQFTLSDANTYPINLAYGQTATVSISFSPTSAGNKTAQLQIVANAKETHTADLSGTAFAEGSLRESFEGSFPPEGWSKAPSTWAQSSSQHYDGAKSAYYYPFAVASDVKLITPQLTIVAGNTFKYYGRTSSGTTQSIQIEYSSDLISWTNIGSSNTLTTTWTEYTVDLSSIAGNNYYLAIAATTTNSSGGSFYVDYVRGPVIYVAPPQPATIGAPANAASKVNINTTLTWSAGATGGTPQGYKLYFGTDGGGTVAPTNIENGTVQTSPYTPAAPLTFGTTYYWQVVPFNNGGDATGCPIWSFSTMTGQAGLWNGTISNDWADVSNWDNAQLPSASTDIIIPTGLTNYPTLSAAGTCHNLTIEPGASLLGNTNLTVTGTANVQLTIEGALAGDNDKWHLISQPVASIAQASNVFNHCYLKQYNETTNLYEDVAGTTPLNTIGKGYSTMYSYQNGAPTSKTLEFTGGLNDGSYSVPLSFTSGQGEGWNLVGNPYPSAIDWDAVSGLTKPAEMNNSIYFWDNSLNGGIGNFTYYLGAEGSNQGVGVSGGSRYIAAMQGFFVKTSASATLVMDNGIRIHNNTPFYKDGNTNSLIRLQVVSGNYSDETVVRFDANATSEADNAYDCWKLFASNVPQLSTVTTDNVNMAINTFPKVESNLIVPLQLNAGITGNFTIQATEMLNFNGSPVMLEDKILNITQDLTQNPIYSFTASIGDNPDRFNLHFKSVNGINDPSESKVTIYSWDKTVYINPGKVNLHGQVVVYDILGKPVATKQLEGSSLYCLQLNITPGCYIVKVITGNNVYSQKVVIK